MTSGNTNAPSIMIGERVADFVAEDSLAATAGRTADGGRPTAATR